MYGGSRNHQKLVGHKNTIIRCITRDILSVATTKYPFIIGAKRRGLSYFVLETGDGVVTFIVEMHDTKTRDSAPPFRDGYVGKFKLESPNKVKIAKFLWCTHE
jgi:hypothetical protein